MRWGRISPDVIDSISAVMTLKSGVVLAALLVCLVAGSTRNVVAAPTLTVDTTEDSFDGSCADGDCSLRDAVKSAPKGARIEVPPGFYPLVLTGSGGVGEGSIELRRRVEIAGIGETGAFIDATALGAPAFTIDPRSEGDTRFTLANLTVFGAHDATLIGAAIDVRNGCLRVVAVTVTGGIADRGGGIAVDAGARLRLVDSLVIGNEAASRGGGIWNEGSLVITGSAVADNRAVDGGGIWSGPGSATSLENTTVAENSSSADGGGLWLGAPAEITATTVGGNNAATGGGVFISLGAGAIGAERSIVAGNVSGRARQCHGKLQSLGHNVEQGHRCGFDSPSDLEDTDARLRPLGGNGGPTPTMALSARSPATDLAGACGGRDQRGAPRDRSCDAGAYEVVRCLGLIVNIVGTPDHDELSGGRGPDAFIGLGGNDEFQGSIGTDRACGGPGDDLLIAGPGDDRFHGEAGNDRVRGESGDDVLYGGPGRDRLSGGPGDDVCRTDVTDRRARGCERLT